MVDIDPESLAQQLVRVSSRAEIDALPVDTRGVLACGLDDAGLSHLAKQVPNLRYLVTDGAAQVTDSGLPALGGLLSLEVLDLEYAPITDVGLQAIIGHPRLQWVDLGGCAGITPAGMAALRARRPTLHVEWQ